MDQLCQQRHSLRRKELRSTDARGRGIVSSIDTLAYIVSILSLLFTADQIRINWIKHDAGGVSFLSWLFYAISAFVWLVYGLVHKDSSHRYQLSLGRICSRCCHWRSDVQVMRERPARILRTRAENRHELSVCNVVTIRSADARWVKRWSKVSWRRTVGCSIQRKGREVFTMASTCATGRRYRRQSASARS